ncbi:MAG: tripartite tricarboxylate transporter substrate-binding protein, partial [Vicinamibacterales bacterium]
LAEFAPQIEAGTVRALGISSHEQLPGVPIPTLREQGVNVELENWRSLVAPPGIGPADRERLEKAVERMVRSAEWRQELERYRWIDRYLAGDEFTRFAQSEDQRVHAILTKLGLGAGETTPPTAGFYPVLVLVGLMFWVGAAALETVRAHAASPTNSAGPGWGSAALIAAGMAIDLALIEQAGFVLASASLFWLTARAFDAQHPGRDALFGLAVSTGAYLLFVRVLNVTLPAGFLARWF